MQNFQVLSSGTPNSSLFRTKTQLNDVFAIDLALRNGEYKEQSGNQVFNGLQATVMNYYKHTFQWNIFLYLRSVMGVDGDINIL